MDTRVLYCYFFKFFFFSSEIMDFLGSFFQHRSSFIRFLRRDLAFLFSFWVYFLRWINTPIVFWPTVGFFCFFLLLWYNSPPMQDPWPSVQWLGIFPRTRSWQFSNKTEEIAGPFLLGTSRISFGELVSLLELELLQNVCALYFQVWYLLNQHNCETWPTEGIKKWLRLGEFWQRWQIE